MTEKSKPGLFSELRRRNVFRVAVAYVVSAWLVIQVADTVFPYLGVPDRVVRILIVALGIGLIPSVVLAWIYEITPFGIARQKETDAAGIAAHGTGVRPVDYVVIAVLFFLVTIYVFDRSGGWSGKEEGEIVGAAISSIAVLPFENRSAETSDTYFVDGIHDDILTNLARIGSLRVISRTSVENYQDSGLSIPEIAEELNVGAILEGGVQRVGDTIRINVQLIDARADAHIWAEAFDRRMTAENLFAIQTEVAETIASALNLALTPAEHERLTQVPTLDLAAYDLYLLGNQRLRLRTGESIEQALKFFQQAAVADPAFALAWVGIADSYLLLRDYQSREPDEVRAPALAAAERAIGLDPGLGEAWASLAMINHSLGGADDPEPLFERAIELSPNYATARQWYAEFLGHQRRDEEAIEQLEIAVTLDPRAPIIQSMLAAYLRHAGRYDESSARLERALDIDPGFAPAYRQLALLHNQFGRWAESLIAARKAEQLSPETRINVALQGVSGAHLDDQALAMQAIARAESVNPDDGLVMHARATVELSVPDFDAALATSRRALALSRPSFIHRLVLTEQAVRDGDLEAASQLALPRPATGELDPAKYDNVLLVRALARASLLKLAGSDSEATELTDYVLQSAGAKIASMGDHVSGRSQDELAAYIHASIAHAINGELDASLELFEDGVEAGYTSWWFLHCYHNRSFDSLRDSARFQAACARVREGLASQRELLRD